jgi:hypothetical protein
MMDEIDYFVSCILIFRWIFWAIPIVGGVALCQLNALAAW